VGNTDLAFRFQGTEIGEDAAKGKPFKRFFGKDAAYFREVIVLTYVSELK
jgi:hypothetical protein